MTFGVAFRHGIRPYPILTPYRAFVAPPSFERLLPPAGISPESLAPGLRNSSHRCFLKCGFCGCAFAISDSSNKYDRLFDTFLGGTDLQKRYGEVKQNNGYLVVEYSLPKDSELVVGGSTGSSPSSSSGNAGGGDANAGGGDAVGISVAPLPGHQPKELKNSHLFADRNFMR